MTSIKTKKSYEIRMVNLSFIGCILLLNMVDQDRAVAGYDKDQVKLGTQQKKLAKRYTSSNNMGNIVDCIRLFRKPTAVILFVPASAQADTVIKNLHRKFHLDNLSQADVRLYLKRYSPKRNSKAVEPNFL